MQRKRECKIAIAYQWALIYNPHYKVNHWLNKNVQEVYDEDFKLIWTVIFGVQFKPNEYWALAV